MNNNNNNNNKLANLVDTCTNYKKIICPKELIHVQIIKKLICPKELFGKGIIPFSAKNQYT